MSYKKAFFLFSLFSITPFLWAQTASIESNQQVEKEELRRITMKVKGLVCPFCVQGLSKVLKKRPEIADFHVELKSGIVTIDARPGQDIKNEELIKIMEDNGISTSYEDIKRNWKK